MATKIEGEHWFIITDKEDDWSPDNAVWYVFHRVARFVTACWKVHDGRPSAECKVILENADDLVQRWEDTRVDFRFINISDPDTTSDDMTVERLERILFLITLGLREGPWPPR